MREPAWLSRYSDYATDWRIRSSIPSKKQRPDRLWALRSLLFGGVCVELFLQSCLPSWRSQGQFCVYLAFSLTGVRTSGVSASFYIVCCLPCCVTDCDHCNCQMLSANSHLRCVACAVRSATLPVLVSTVSSHRAGRSVVVGLGSSQSPLHCCG